MDVLEVNVGADAGPDIDLGVNGGDPLPETPDVPPVEDGVDGSPDGGPDNPTTDPEDGADPQEDPS